MKSSEWAYFAGLFDGEGSVTISQCTRKTATVSCRAGTTVTNQSLRISNNNPDPLYELEEKFGGRVRKHSPNRKESYVWICQGYDAVKFAKGILPFSRIKKQQLEIYIQFSELKREKAQGRTRLSHKEISNRLQLIARLDRARKDEGGKVGLRLISEESVAA